MLHDMQLKEEERKEMSNCMATGAPEYPYGLRIEICPKSYKMLGLTDPPKVGQKMIIEAVVEVKSISDEKKKGDAPEYAMSLQIIQMGLESPKEETKSTSDIMYGSKE